MPRPADDATAIVLIDRLMEFAVTLHSILDDIDPTRRAAFLLLLINAAHTAMCEMPPAADPERGLA